MFYVIVNKNSIEKHIIQIKNGILMHVNMSEKGIVRAKNIIVGKHFKSIADDKVIACDEIVSVTNSVITNVTITIPTNVTNTVSINFYNKKVTYKMDCYILHTFLLVTICLYIIAIICYHYAKYRSKQKIIVTLTI